MFCNRTSALGHQGFSLDILELITGFRDPETTSSSPINNNNSRDIKLLLSTITAFVCLPECIYTVKGKHSIAIAIEMNKLWYISLLSDFEYGNI